MATLSQFHLTSTHRLIPEKYSQSGSVLENLDLSANVLSNLSELDAATNERKLAERKLTGIGPHELVFGVPEAQIVNAAFTHPGTNGGRFNTSKRGAWYAGLELDTSIAEVSFHKQLFLRNSLNDLFHVPHTFSYVDFQADFHAFFHVLNEDERRSCLQPMPVPQCYAASQRLAEQLLFAKSLGIIYPSVRYLAGHCVACFRPALIQNPRREASYQISIDTDTDYSKVRPVVVESNCASSFSGRT